MSNWILTLGHHRLDQLEWCFEHNRLFCTSGAKTAFLWQHYPLPNKSLNELRIRSLVEKYPEVVFFDAGVGLGAGGGIRYLCQKLRLDDSDKVIIRDPDENVAALGWDTAIFDAMSDPLYPIIGVLTPHIKLELEDRGFSIESANGYPIYVPKQPCMMSVCGFRCDWWLPSGGFRDSGRDYGGTEVHTWPMLGMTGKRWVI